MFWSKKKSKLPNVPIYVLTGEIPENFGGVTTVALGRCNIFTSVGSSPTTTLLTVSPAHAMTLDTLRDELIDDGRLDSRVIMRNPWSDLIRIPDDEMSRLKVPSGVPIPVGRSSFEGEFEVRYELDQDGGVRIDRFREDASLAVADQRVNSNPVKRLITLFYRDGRIAGQWTSATAMYHEWLRFLTERHEMSIVIAERLTTSNLFTTWEARNVVFVQAIHSHHYTIGALRKFEFPAPKAKFYRALDNRDLVATLTAQQAADLRSSGLSASKNLATLPNWLTEEPIRRLSDRDRSRGVIVSRVSKEKQIDQSLRCIGELGIAYASVSLDIFGEGAERAALEDFARSAGLSDRVQFKGYTARGGKKFREYSFSLHTGRTEGQLLVILESMAAGCIPIAYDIEYGPSDSITHGVDGFLVEPNNVEGLARQIEHFMALPDAEVARMRKAAIRRSKDFSAEKICRRWANELQRAVARKQSTNSLEGGRAYLGAVRVDGDGVVLRIGIADMKAALDWSWAKVSWIQRETGTYGRVPAKIERRKNKLVVRARLDLDHLAPTREDSTKPLGLWVDLGDASQMKRIRITGLADESVLQGGPFELSTTRAGSLIANVPAE